MAKSERCLSNLPASFVQERGSGRDAADPNAMEERVCGVRMVVGDGMVGRQTEISREIRSEQRGVHANEPKNRRTEVRALIVATNPVKVGGAKVGRKMDAKRKETGVGRVSEKTKHLTEAQRAQLERLRSLADTRVWTDRMLTTLVTGVKRGKWYCLIDKVVRTEVLEGSFERVKRNRGAQGVDQVTIERFERHKAHNLAKLGSEIASGKYRPLAVKRVEIPKGGGKTRPLGIPVVRDRVAHNALKTVIEPIFECEFSDNSYGFRPGRSCEGALQAVDQALTGGFQYVVDADVEGFFDNVDHKRLMGLVAARISDGKVLAMIDASLKQKVMDELREWQPTQGTPQGAVLSPLLANLYLHDFDLMMERLGFRTTRYADDFVVCCRTREEAEKALAAVRQWMTQAKLTLHPEKTRIADLAQGERFTFLGYEYGRTKKGEAKRWPSKKSEAKLREKLRPLTKRCNGCSMEVIIKKITPITRGWFNYFSTGGGSFVWVDAWTRMRLRSILRKRSKRKGRGRGLDHHRWPNAYFEQLGYFSLEAARYAKLSTPSG